MQSLERETTEKPVKLAIVRADLRGLAGAIHLPEGYQILDVAYNQYSRVLDLLITGEALPEVEEGHLVPIASLRITVEYASPDRPDYRKITSEVRVSQGQV